MKPSKACSTSLVKIQTQSSPRRGKKTDRIAKRQATRRSIARAGGRGWGGVFSAPPLVPPPRGPPPPRRAPRPPRRKPPRRERGVPRAEQDVRRSTALHQLGHHASHGHRRGGGGDARPPPRQPGPLSRQPRAAGHVVVSRRAHTPSSASCAGCDPRAARSQPRRTPLRSPP